MKMYRFRTRLRTLLPFALIGLVPKGRRDCGDHEWYRQEGDVYRCYHCAAGVRRHLAG
ncbi:hypothetical protein OWR29_09710 [Actinoplanes sp. Pm04-4]|uniref:Uncharacterized protein n=1 Tax=Paractinoplanes pyxinae TaxID=2997416 RepID=A0ABT4AVL0_9ACTN|nr:hypothetical protein [Actinoplanes pyxinae]MCY1138273.1 hypothetical protein [Actinoplanes pyxinae]